MALLLKRGLKYVFLAVFPLILILVTLAPEILHVWLGASFASRSAVVLRLLAAGVLINCLSLIVSVLVQAAGRPDLTAKFHMVELPIYLCAVWWMIRTHGIEGAAGAWTGRILLDALLLACASMVLLPDTRRVLVRTGSALLAGVASLGLATLIVGILPKLLFLSIFLLCTITASWFLMFTPAERAFALSPARLIFRKNLS
jgi:O-antigen/teichoic acid export membrane protein